MQLNLKEKLIIGVVVTLFTLPGFGRSLELVKNSKAVGRIILQANTSPSEKFAAEELVSYIKKISGAQLTIQSDMSKNSIVLGTLKNLKNVPIEIKKRLIMCDKKDAFYIKTCNDRLYIVGKTPGAVLYGAYAFLEKLGVRWFYPGELGEHCPTIKNIELGNIDDFQSPSMVARKAQLVGASFNYRDGNLWAARQKLSSRYISAKRWFTGCSEKQALFLNKACNFYNYSSGHMPFELAVPESMFKEHPEYFPLRDGKRKAGRHLQRCISNPEVFRLVAEFGLKWCSNKKNVFTIGAADNINSWCECDKCRALGTVNGVYKVTNLYHRFYHKVVQYILQRNPDARIDIYFYINYLEAPDDKSILYKGKNVRGMYCTCWPFKRCYAHRISDANCERNKKCLATMKQVLKICPMLFTYEYLDCSKANYAPTYKTVAHDIPFLGTLGINGYMEETIPVNGEMIKKIDSFDRRSFWRSTWMTHYLIAKLQWNNKLNVDKVIANAYRDYYGAAAPIMTKYHNLRLKLWNNAPGHVFYGGARRTGFCLTIPGMTEKLKNYLKQAKRTVLKDKLRSKRIALDSEYLESFWEKPAKQLEKLFSAEQNIIPRKVSGKIKIDGKLSEDDWLSARSVANFMIVGTTQEPVAKSNFRVLYDKNNIYIGFEAINDAAWSAETAKTKKHDGKLIWTDDHIELQLMPENSNDFYHLAINTKGKFYDSKISSGKTDVTYDSKAEIETSKLKDRFIYEVKLPISSMNGHNSLGQSWKIYVLRDARNLQPPQSKEFSSLGGYPPHNPEMFRQMIIGKNVARNGNFALLGEYKDKRPKDILGTPGKFPKYWHINSEYCKVNRNRSGHSISYRTGTLYSYMGKYKKGISVSVHARGEGQITGWFSSWKMELNPETGKNQRSKKMFYKNNKYFPLSLKNKIYNFKYTPSQEGEEGFFYVYVKGNVVISSISAVIIENK